MANGEMPPDLTALDITLPGTLNNGNNMVSWGGYQCYYYSGQDNVDSSMCQTHGGLGMRRFYEGYDPKARYCIADNSYEEGKKFCQSIGGKDPFNNGKGLMHYLLP